MKKYAALSYNRVFLVERVINMYSILIDSHSDRINLVLYKNHKQEYIMTEKFDKQSKIIIPKIIEILEKAGLAFNDLKEIVVISGPGSFTGTRLSVTIAKTLAYTLNIAIKSISSIKLLAVNTISDSDYSVALPDQKGYFIGEFNKDNKIIGDYFYLSKQEFIKYQENHKIVDNIEIDWNNIYKYNCLTDEDCYNIKPLYIKKIEVEK